MPAPPPPPPPSLQHFAEAFDFSTLKWLRFYESMGPRCERQLHAMLRAVVDPLKVPSTDGTVSSLPPFLASIRTALLATPSSGARVAVPAKEARTGTTAAAGLVPAAARPAGVPAQRGDSASVGADSETGAQEEVADMLEDVDIGGPAETASDRTSRVAGAGSGVAGAPCFLPCSLTVTAGGGGVARWTGVQL